ncbi:HopJ type III effector protein [Thalassotalea sp. PLHSN55]|uniref:HopJ type III effector protein n=1 Tax=Thalassotalea sp. PLHSN55 TaxID=3435888 RepID=UPI003F8386B0
MHTADLLKQLESSPETIEFSQVMATIENDYIYTPTTFTNGNVVNDAGTNEGSCKLFAFAQLNQLTEQQTLNLFGAYYREDVLQNPKGTDHANIRNFILTGWQGVELAKNALTVK